MDELESKSKNIGGKIVKISIFVVVVIVFSQVIKSLGRQAGIHDAKRTVEQESISQKAPTGLMGAKWLMPVSEAKSMFPDAIESTEKNHTNLRFKKNAFSRSAFIDLTFKNDLLLMILVNFIGDKNEKTYIQTQNILSKEYGQFNETTDALNNEKISTSKTIGRVTINHILYEKDGKSAEQIVLYRTKEN